MDNSVTFWRQDATLLFPNFDFGSSDGDIYFQFRTTLESAVFLHATGDKHELKATLISPTELQLHLVTSNGAIALLFLPLGIFFLKKM